MTSGCSSHPPPKVFWGVSFGSLLNVEMHHLTVFIVDLDTTKLKARQFSRGTAAPSSSKNDNSLWTETPAERQQRLADEVSGKKRRVTDAPADEAEEIKARKRQRKAEEEAIRKGVDEHTVCVPDCLVTESH